MPMMDILRAMSRSARRPMDDQDEEDLGPAGRFGNLPDDAFGPTEEARPIQFLSRPEQRATPPGMFLTRPGDANGAEPKARMLPPLMGGSSAGLGYKVQPAAFEPGQESPLIAGNYEPVAGASPKERMLPRAGIGSAHTMRPAGGRDLGSAIAFASWKANNPDRDPNEFWAAREGQRGAGGDVASYQHEIPDVARTGNPMLDSLRSEAARGNPQAVAKLEYLGNNPNFARQLLGNTPIEQEQQAQQFAQQRAYDDHELAMGNLRMKGEQQRVINEHNAKLLALEEKIKMGELSRKDADSLAARSIQEAKLKLAEVAQQAEQERANRDLGLREKEIGLKYAPKPLDEDERANKALDRRLKTAQITAIERQPEEQKAEKQKAQAGQMANEEAQLETSLVGKTEPERAQLIGIFNRRRATMGMPPTTISATEDVSPETLQREALRLGYDSPEDAVDAATNAESRKSWIPFIRLYQSSADAVRALQKKGLSRAKAEAFVKAAHGE